MPSLSAQTVQMVQQDAPWFLDQVAQAQRRRRKTLTLSLNKFEDNPLLLYACLWYASTEGVSVRVLPATLAQNNRKED